MPKPSYTRKGLFRSIAVPLILTIVSIIGASRTSFVASSEAQKPGPLRVTAQRVKLLIPVVHARSDIGRAYLASFNASRGGSLADGTKAGEVAFAAINSIQTQTDSAIPATFTSRLIEISQNFDMTEPARLTDSLNNADLLLTDWPSPLLAEAGLAGDVLDESIDTVNLVVNLYLDIRGARIKVGLDQGGTSVGSRREDVELERYRGDPAWRSFGDAIGPGENKELPKLNQALLSLADDPNAKAFTASVRWITDSNRVSKNQPSLENLNKATLRMLDRNESAVLIGVDELAAQISAKAAVHQQRSIAFYGLALAFAMLALSAGFITARRTRNHFTTLRNEAETDNLTGLMNRAGVRRHVAPWFVDKSETGTIGALIVDVDNFKMVNDSFGHQGGDQVLIEVALRLKRGILAGTSEVSRWGGDEFFLLLQLERDGVAGLGRVAERLQKLVNEPLEVNGTLVNVGVTIGGVCCLCGSCDPDDLFRAADRSLYQGKNAGRNRNVINSCTTQPVSTLIGLVHVFGPDTP